MTIKNISFNIHWSLFLGIAAIAASLYSFYHSLILSLIVTLGVYLSILVHELCHVITASRLNIQVKSVQLNFFGAVAKIDKDNLAPKKEILISLAGPLCSIVIFLFVFPFSDMLAALNFIIAGFNLLPAYPLDGGRAFRAFLSMYIDPYKSTYISIIPTLLLVSIFFAVSLVKMQKGDFLNGLKFGAFGAYLFSLVPSKSKLRGYFDKQKNDA